MAETKAVTVAAFDVATTTGEPAGVLLQLFARAPEGLRPVPTMFIDADSARRLLETLQRAVERL